MLVLRSVGKAACLYYINAFIESATSVVGLVTVPDCLVEADMPYQEAVTGKIGIPAILLAVFNYKKLIIKIGWYDVCLVALRKRFEGYAFRAYKFSREHPTHGIALHCRIIRRCAAVIVI